MNRNEKVLKGLRLCRDEVCPGAQCPYYGANKYCMNQLHKEAAYLIQNKIRVCGKCKNFYKIPWDQESSRGVCVNFRARIPTEKIDEKAVVYEEDIFDDVYSCFEERIE